jgi:hypothetical protein|nr:MAG TPA: hypothetical protein [Caudoviricetes sp.]
MEKNMEENFNIKHNDALELEFMCKSLLKVGYSNQSDITPLGGIVSSYFFEHNYYSAIAIVFTIIREKVGEDYLSKKFEVMKDKISKDDNTFIEDLRDCIKFYREEV